MAVADPAPTQVLTGAIAADRLGLPSDTRQGGLVTDAPIGEGRPVSTVLVTLRGGLGNQMFQYAIGRSIAEKHGRRLFLDDLALRIDHPGRTRRAYALGAFNIKAELTSRARVEGCGIRAVLVQERRGFHEQVLKPCPLAQLELQGFWQDERYFLDIAHVLRAHFRMRPGPWESSRWQPLIAATPNAVCVHVRRQDYLTPQGGGIGFVGQEYYRRAIAAMARLVQDVRYFVFSDDIPWCREYLPLDHSHSFIEHDCGAGDHTCTDFSLMTLCRHFIIANSSFSWWAAWLGSDPRKIVIAPKVWFHDIPSDSDDIVPRAWFRI